MMRIRLDIRAITASSTQTAQAPAAFQDIIQADLTRHHDRIEDSLTHVYEQVDQRIGAVERILEAQSAQLAASQSILLGNFYGPRYRHRQKRPAKKETQHPGPGTGDSLAVHVNQYNCCRPACHCVCHMENRSSTPSFMDRVLGQVFVGYSGLPGFSSKCNVGTCEKSQSPSMSFEYWFPLGFVWSQIVRMRLTYERNLGPHFEISTLKRVPDSAQCVTFALNGNTEGLKDLFRRGLASPRDVSSTRGYSVLRVYSSSSQVTGDILTVLIVGHVRQTVPDVQIPRTCRRRS